MYLGKTFASVVSLYSASSHLPVVSVDQYGIINHTTVVLSLAVCVLCCWCGELDLSRVTHDIDFTYFLAVWFLLIIFPTSLPCATFFCNFPIFCGVIGDSGLSTRSEESTGWRTTSAPSHPRLSSGNSLPWLNLPDLVDFNWLWSH